MGFSKPGGLIWVILLSFAELTYTSVGGQGGVGAGGAVL